MIQEEYHTLVLETRSIEYILTTKRFIESYEHASVEEKVKLKQILRSTSKLKLLKWIEDQIKEDLGCWPVSKLRQIARSMRIPNYSELTKQLLLSEIMKRKQYEKENTSNNS